jgi:serine/threonine-protein kinase RsbW
VEARAARHSASASQAVSAGVLLPSGEPRATSEPATAGGSGLTGYVPGSRPPGDPAAGPPGLPSVDTAPSSMKGANVAGDPDADPDADIVLLTLPANSVYLSVLRTATAGLAARLHFTLDEIEDLRIAVDEACAMLLAGEELPDSELHCRFTLTPDEIDVTVTLPGVRRSLPPQNTFAWQVLTALTGEVDAEVDDDQLTIGLVKRRSRNP